MAIMANVNKLIYPEEIKKQEALEKTNAYILNPFLRRDGTLANKYLNYQSLLDNPKMDDKVKKYITEATGLQQAVSAAPEPSTVPAVSDSAAVSNSSASNISSAFNGKIGSISAKYEVGGWNPGRVSTGTGDHGGVSYGMPQFSTNMGSAKSFVNWLKQTNPDMGNAFGNYTPGTTEFSNAWKSVAAKYGDAFGEIQNQYAYNNYAEPFIQKAKEKTGVDLSKTPALMELAFSTAVQFGSGGTYALGGINPNMSEQEIIKTVYDNKINNYKTYYRSSSADVQAGVRNRWVNEYQDLLAMSGGTPASANTASNSTPVSSSGGSYVKPLDNINITSKFGLRNAPTAGASTQHNGIDLAAPAGTPIKAFKDGEIVASAFDKNGGGYYIAVKHADGTTSKYLHMQQQGLPVGTKVNAGTVIGKVGSTGRSTGPHLDFRIQDASGKYLNPEQFLK